MKELPGKDASETSKIQKCKYFEKKKNKQTEEHVPWFKKKREEHVPWCWS